MQRAAQKIIHMAEPTKHSRSRRPSPRETKPRNGYCHPVTDNVLFDLLRMARLMRERFDEPYSREAAAVSLYLDRDKGQEKSKADYCRIWGWGRKQLDKRWDALEAMLEYWSSRFSKGKGRGSEGEGEGKEIEDSGEKSKGQEKRRGSEGEGEGKLTNTTLTPPPEGEESEWDAREEISPPLNHPDPPAEEASADEATSTEEEPSPGEEAPPADDVGAWSEEARPVVRAWIEWHGRDKLIPAIHRTIQLLMMPAGSGRGAWISDDPTRTRYDGFTAEQVIIGIESMAKRNHHSADSLVRHVAGLMPAAGDKHGNVNRGSSEKAGARATTHFQASREVGRSGFNVEDYERFGDVLRAIDESDHDEPPAD